jgi:hypothetical protein
VVRLLEAGPAQPADQGRHGQQEEQAADQVDERLSARRQPAIDDIDAHMAIVLEGIAGAEHEDQREKIPLDFQPGVGTHVDAVAHQGIAGRDQHRGQHQPDDGATDRIVETVDAAGDGE